MNFSNFFLTISMISLACSAPIQAAGFRPKATVALAAAAGSLVANGLHDALDFIKNDKYSLARTKIYNLEKENRHLAALVDATKQQLDGTRPELMFILGTILGVSVVGFITLLVLSPKNVQDSSPEAISDKQELAVKA